jgi:DNA-binding MarR family transcriptional regulator
MRVQLLSQQQSATLREEWRELVAQHARVNDALERALRERHDLSVSEYEVLQRLVETADGKRRMQELADEIHLSQSALSRLVSRLEESGLARRSICDHDRRGVWACITEAGRVLQAAAEPIQDEVLVATLRR